MSSDEILAPTRQHVIRGEGAEPRAKGRPPYAPLLLAPQKPEKSTSNPT